MIKNSNITNEQKEKRLQEIDFTSITSTRGNPVVGHICINPTKNMYNRLIENNNNFFLVPLNRLGYCTFSPKQALDILKMINNKTKGIRITLTKGSFYYTYVSNDYVFQQDFDVFGLSPEELEELKNWLTEILTIGGYLNTNNKKEKKTTSSKSVIKYRIKDNTIYATDGKNTGKATCNTKLDTFDEKKGKLIATMRALGFDKKTEERVIDALFGETVNTKELLKAIDKLIIER